MSFNVTLFIIHFTYYLMPCQFISVYYFIFVSIYFNLIVKYIFFQIKRSGFKIAVSQRLLLKKSVLSSRMYTFFRTVNNWLFYILKLAISFSDANITFHRKIVWQNKNGKLIVLYIDVQELLFVKIALLISL